MNKSIKAHWVCLLIAGSSVVGCGASGEASESEFAAGDKEGALAQKQVQVSDESGMTHALVTVRSNDPAALEALDPSAIQLTPVMATDVASEQAAEADVAGADVGAAEADAGETYQVEVSDEVLGDGVIGFELNLGDTNFRAPFKWRYYYDTQDCVDVTRQAVLYRVWGSVWYKLVSSGEWQTVVEGELIKNSQTMHKCRENSYQLKVGVRARKTSHYSLQFDN